MDRPFLRHFWGSQAHRLIVGEGNGQTPPITPICPSATGPGVPTDSPLGGSADRYRGSADAHGFLGGRLPHPRRRDRRQILHLIMNREPLAADLAGDGVARGWFRRRGKGQDFVFGLVHSFAAWGGFARHGADGVHRSCWTRLYLRLAPAGLSSRPVACQPVRGRCLRRRILLRPSSLLPFGPAHPRCSWGSADVLSAWGPPSSPPAAETPAAGRRSSIEAFLLGTRRGPTHTTIPPVGFGRFLV